MSNDSLLPMFWDVLKQRSEDPAQSVSFIVRLIAHRLTGFHDSLLVPRIQFIPDLGELSRLAWETLMEMLVQLVSGQPGPLLISSPDWFHNATVLLLSNSRYPLPKSVLSSYHLMRLMEATQYSLQQGYEGPAKSFSRIVRLFTILVGTEVDGLRVPRIYHVPDLSLLSEELWKALMEMLAELVSQRQPGQLLDTSPDWLHNAALLLLSRSRYPLPESAISSHLSMCLMDNGDIRNAILAAFHQRSDDPAESYSFIIRLITSHMDSRALVLLQLPRIPHILDLSRLSRKAWNMFMEMLAQLGSRQPGPLLVSSPDWLHNATILLLSRSRYPLTQAASSSHLSKCLMDDNSPLATIYGLLASPSWLQYYKSDPAWIFAIILCLITSHMGAEARELMVPRIRCIPDLRGLSRQVWDKSMSLLALLPSRLLLEPLDVSSPDWLHNLTLMLLSRSEYPLPYLAASGLASLIDGSNWGRDRFFSLSSWIIPRIGSAHSAFEFRPLSPRLAPLFAEVIPGRNPSLLTILTMYIALLQTYCRSPPYPDSLYMTLSREQHLFLDSRTRPILNDLWDTLYANMMAKCGNGRLPRYGTLEGHLSQIFPKRPYKRFVLYYFNRYTLPRRPNSACGSFCDCHMVILSWEYLI